MLRLLRALPPGTASAVACPSGGPLAATLAEHGVEHLPIRGTGVSFRLHPRWTPVGLADLGRSVADLRRHVRHWRPDVMHANGTRAGLLAVPVRRTGGAGLVVQVHDVMPEGRVSRAVRSVLARGADEVVAVSDAATRAFNAGFHGRLARTVYISIDHGRFSPHGHDRVAVRRSLGVPEDAPLLGEVAQITPWKGQLVAIKALARVRRDVPSAQLVLVGGVAFSGPGVRYDNAAYARRLQASVAELGLEDAVRFAGHRRDVPSVMAALDLFLLPSWNEPFGTVVVEAMATGTVPLVSDGGGVPEFVEDGVSGRVLPTHDADAWGDAAAQLLADGARRAEMGRRALEVAARFTDEAYVAEMLRSYAAVAR
jgi:L-malate glycosyltransferase